MSAPNDGGPAFPRDERYAGHNGMTLRDYFAAKAMQGVCASDDHCDEDGETFIYEDGYFSDVATHAYAMADAMLKAREVKP